MTKTKGLTFAEAVEALEKGKKVRRSNWRFMNQVLVRQGPMLAIEMNKQRRPYEVNGAPPRNDAAATDWEIVDES
jgi:hypothetical protein